MKRSRVPCISCRSGRCAIDRLVGTTAACLVPRDGKLSVEVVLKQAQWVEIKKEKENEVWTPLGEVRGLPSSKSITKQIQTAAK